MQIQRSIVSFRLVGHLTIVWFDFFSFDCFSEKKSKQQSSSSMGKLTFAVISCTGEDPEFPAAELNIHSPTTKGWLSPRFCEFPQEVILSFKGNKVRVQQVQFLSHQSKIATKLELYVGKADSLPECSFKRLGYMSLDNNERSGHRARELKSVYVDSQCTFLKVRLHKCYINKYNLYNQVGLIAINVLGEADHALGLDGPTTRLPKALGGQDLPDHMSQKSVLALDDLAFDMNFDDVTAQKIREVNLAKQYCVAQENYEQAKSLKAVEQQLKVIGVQLAKMVTQKRAAVQREDYDVAQSLKGEIDRLRMGIEDRLQRIPAFHEYLRKAQAAGGAGAGPPPRGSGIAASSPANARRPMEPIYNNATGNGGSPNKYPQGFQGGQQVVMPTPLQNRRANEVQRDDRPIGGGSNGPSAQVHNVHAQSPPPKRPSPQQPIQQRRPKPAQEAPQAKPADPNAPPPGKDLIARSPVKGATRPPAQRPKERSPRSMGPGGASAGGMSEQPPKAAPRSGPHPLSGVSGADNLPDPEPMSAAATKDADDLIRLFGEYVASCLYSKTWALREAAMNKVNLDLEKHAREQGDMGIFAAIAHMLNMFARDKVSQVFLAALSILQRTLTVCHDLRRGEVTSMLGMFTPALVEKVGDSNPRVRQESASTLMVMAQAPCLGPPYVSSMVLRKPKKSQMTSKKPVVGRLSLIRSLVMAYGLGPTSGISLDAVMEHIKVSNGFAHGNNEVRVAAKELCVALYQACGDQIEPYLGGLREKQLEEYRAAFAAAGGAPPGKSKAKNDNRQRKQQKRREQIREMENVNREAATALGGGGGNVANSPVRGSPGQVRVTGPDGRDINININVTTSPSNAGGNSKMRNNEMSVGQDESEEADLDPFTCQFCNRYDPNFTDDLLDMHYWKECPVLTSCRHCGQVVEIMCLHEHMTTECEHRDKFKKDNAGKLKQMERCCPLCQVVVKPAGEAGWRRHLLSGVGCSGNPRTKHLQGK